MKSAVSGPSPSAIVAFLRGINVGGRKKVPMATLKEAFQAMGFKDVRTVLASGNVIFEAPGRDPHLDMTISRGLEKALGFPVAVIVRTVRELKAIVASEPFKAALSGPDIQQYVTFLKGEKNAPSRVRLPAPPEGTRIVHVDPGEVYSVVMLSRGRTPDLMRYLDRSLGPAGTTRNWRTVVKLAGGER
jgi:uncharacterized protein (DUF1697 family)